ncbi:hypothetical protein BDZ88DRAFT_441476 [Geranomyces variabilis]|nr:hypothetical protein BDZ88DRAFT_441476 [Geranomyces variabilis]
MQVPEREYTPLPPHLTVAHYHQYPPPHITVDVKADQPPPLGRIAGRQVTVKGKCLAKKSDAGSRKGIYTAPAAPYGNGRRLSTQKKHRGQVPLAHRPGKIAEEVNDAARSKGAERRNASHTKKSVRKAGCVQHEGAGNQAGWIELQEHDDAHFVGAGKVHNQGNATLLTRLTLDCAQEAGVKANDGSTREARIEGGWLNLMHA